MKRLLSKGCAALIVLSVVSCDECKNTTEVRVVSQTASELSITIVDDTEGVLDRLVLEEGDSQALSASALNALGQSIGEITATWSSSNPSVASVTRDGGVVTAQAAGTAQISAFYENVSTSITAEVVSPGGPPAPTPNQPPVATIQSPSPGAAVTLGDPVNFLGTGTDADGVVVSHRWNFGDGTISTFEDPGGYTYAATGSYAVTYRVTDDQGAQSAAATRTVIVNDSTTPPPQPPPSGDFFSDWSAGEYTDGGRWRGESTWVLQGGLRVESGVLKINPTNDLDSWLQIRSVTSALATPSVGQTLEWTWRMRVTQAGTQADDALTHGIGWGGMGVPNEFAVMYFYTQSGRWRPEIYVQIDDPSIPGGGVTYAWSRDSGGAWSKQLDADVWYDFVVSFERVATNTYRPSLEIYETNGNLIASSDEFYNWPLKGSANATSLTEARITNGNPRLGLEFVGFLNGLAGLTGFMTWGEVDFVRMMRR